MLAVYGVAVMLGQAAIGTPVFDLGGAENCLDQAQKKRNADNHDHDG